MDEKGRSHLSISFHIKAHPGMSGQKNKKQISKEISRRQNDWGLFLHKNVDRIDSHGKGKEVIQ